MTFTIGDKHNKRENMNGNFTYCNPTRLHFGEDAMNYLVKELKSFGPPFGARSTSVAE